MTKWTDTPFKDLDVAYAAAKKMGLYPSKIMTDQPSFNFFYIKEGPKAMLLAHSKRGEGPVRECYVSKIPGFGEVITPDEKTLLISDWVKYEKHNTFEAIAEGFREDFKALEHNLVVEVDVKLFIFKGEDYEYEYFLDEQNQMWGRVLYRS